MGILVPKQSKRQEHPLFLHDRHLERYDKPAHSLRLEERKQAVERVAWRKIFNSNRRRESASWYVFSASMTVRC